MRSGKGRSIIIINNLIKWSGSIISIDPKGLNATITAERRGRGNQYCDGMGQDVYVLDPMNCSDVPDELRAHYNLLASLNPNDGDLSLYADMIADAICVIPDGGDAAEWAKEGQEFVSIIIQWVVCAPHIEDKDRNLLTVRNLIMEGECEYSEKLKKQKGINIDPYSILLDDMENSTANKGRIARQARDWKQSVKDLKKYFESIRKSAIRHLKFLNTNGMENVLSDTGVYPRTFNLSDLKNSDKGISLYLCLPPQHANPYGRWQQAMINLILFEMQKCSTKPKIGPLLLSIDEFPLLGYMDSIIDNMNYIGESGVKLFLACQQIVDLKDIYGERFESFMSASALQIWFATGGTFTGEYLSKMLGETEIVKYQRNINTGQSITDTDGTTTTRSTSTANTRGDSTATSSSYSNSMGKSTNWSKSENWSRTQGWNKSYSLNNSTNWGESEGKNAGKNYGPGLFHLFADGSSKNKNSITSQGGSSGTTNSQGTNTSEMQGSGQNHGGGETDTSTNTTGKTESYNTQSTETEGFSNGEQQSHAFSQSIGAGWTETFHKKLLLTIHEAEAYLKAVTDEKHDAFPGLALIKIQGELPFFVRKINYDQDREFERCFNPHPSHPYKPYSELPLLEYEYTQDYFIPITLPDVLLKADYSFLLNHNFKQGDKLKQGEKLFRLKSPFSGSIKEVLSRHDVEIIYVFEDNYRIKTGEFYIVRHSQKLAKTELVKFKQRFQDELWQPLIEWMQTELEKSKENQKQEDERKRLAKLAKQKQKEDERKRLAELESQKQAEVIRKKHEAEKQYQLKIAKYQKKQDEFREARHQGWLQFIAKESEYKQAEISGYRLTPMYKVMSLSIITLLVISYCMGFMVLLAFDNLLSDFPDVIQELNSYNAFDTNDTILNTPTVKNFLISISDIRDSIFEINLSFGGFILIIYELALILFFIINYKNKVDFIKVYKEGLMSNVLMFMSLFCCWLIVMFIPNKVCHILGYRVLKHSDEDFSFGIGNVSELINEINDAIIDINDFSTSVYITCFFSSLVFGVILAAITRKIQNKYKKQEHEVEMQRSVGCLAIDKKIITQKYGKNIDNNKDAPRYDYCYCQSGKNFNNCHGNTVK